MIDAGENGVCRGIGRGRIVIYGFKTIFAHKNRATGEAKLKCLAKRVLNTVLRKRVLNTVLRISVRRGKVLNALERVACHQGKSRRPMISKRKDIHCVEERADQVLRPNIGLEIGLVLVTAINASVEGKATREVMREGQSDVSGSLVLARHIEILSKASDTEQKKFRLLSGAIVREDNIFFGEY